MNPRTTCCRRNLRPRHRRLRRSAQAAASASVGSWRLPFAIATFKARFVISSHLENPAKVAVAAVTRVPVSIASAPFPALPHQSSPLSTNVERGIGGEANVERGIGGEANVERGIGGEANVESGIGGEAETRTGVRLVFGPCP